MSNSSRRGRVVSTRRSTVLLQKLAATGGFSIAVWRGYRAKTPQIVKAMAAKTAVREIEINSESPAFLITR